MTVPVPRDHLTPPVLGLVWPPVVGYPLDFFSPDCE